ncbi:hypothetical protein NMG60_11019259 [Bertholletia excelsa]
MTTTRFHSLSYASPLHRRLSAIATASAAADGGGAPELWCVAKNNAESAALQRALDWACGPGGADCGPIQKGKPCYDPSDVIRTASYAFNDYFLNHGLSDDSCNFDGTAALTSLNPSHGSCKFPSSLTVKNGSFVDSSTAVVGVGPASADMSGGDFSRARWWWTLIITIAIRFLFFCM